MLILLVGGVVGVGCDRKREEAAATRPAAVEVKVEEGPSVLTISGKAYEFPGARIVVEQRDAGVTALVFSEGASPEGAADGYYLEMLLDVAEEEGLDGAVWKCEGKSPARSDEPSAVTVNGGKSQLQPREVTATFGVMEDGRVEVRVNGFFNVFGARDAAAASGVAPVEATLVARKVGP